MIKSRRFALPALLLMAACSDPVGVSEEAAVESVVFSATPALLSEDRLVISATVVATNTSSVAKQLRWGGCGFTLRIYGDLGDEDSRARLLPLTACDDIAKMLTLQPGGTHTLGAALHLSSLRREDLRPGRWWVVAAVDADIGGVAAKFNVTAGSVTLD